MLIGKKGYYYIKIVLFFAFSRRKSFSIKEIAGRLDISEKVMEQVLLLLKNSGILKSKRGPQGGYSLALDPSDMTLMDILERTSQRIDIFPYDVKMGEHPIDDVLLCSGEVLEKDMCRDLKKVTIKNLRKKLSEKVTETGFNYAI